MVVTIYRNKENHNKYLEVYERVCYCDVEEGLK